MAHTKSAGSTKYGRDSQPKYLGVKKSDGQQVKIGDIIIRQRGTRFIPGINVRRGGDDTLFSLAVGKVTFITRRKNNFNGSTKRVSVVNVMT